MATLACPSVTQQGASEEERQKSEVGICIEIEMGQEKNADKLLEFKQNRTTQRDITEAGATF